jgi:hypothetical protein
VQATDHSVHRDCRDVMAHDHAVIMTMIDLCYRHYTPMHRDCTVG